MCKLSDGMLQKWPLALLLASWCTSGVGAGKVLALFPLHAKSHYAFFKPMLHELAIRGHSVDVVGHFPLKDPPPGFRDLSISGSLPAVVNNFTVSHALSIGKLGNALYFFWDINLDVCETTIQHPVLQQLLLSNATYDMVVTELFGVDCMLGFAHHFQAASVQMISSGIVPWGNDRIGNPHALADVPNYFLPYTQPMNFVQRAINVLTTLYLKVSHYFRSDLPVNSFLRRYFGPDTPSVWELQRNISLILVNSHHSLQYSRPSVPAMIEAGGAHIPPVQPLPKAIAAWLDGAGPSGVIYFSFGSLVRPEWDSKERVRSLVDALGALPQRVIWKVEPSEMPPLPPNILAKLWLPQSDILAHPSVVAFVTHGGLMGTLEAVHYGVPMVVAPFFADQLFNAKNYVQRGIAVELNGATFNGEELREAISEITSNPGYRQRARALSRVFTDRAQKPLHEAVYWLEYVMRHRGAPHMRSAAVDLAWWQYLLLDVAAVVVSALVAILFAVRGALQWIFRGRRRKSESAQSSKVSSLTNGGMKMKAN